METGQIFFALLVGVPIMALATLGSLWLVYVVKRPLLGIVGLAIVGMTYCYGDGPSLLLLAPGVFSCIAATKGSGMTLSKRMQ
ncbi:hypothetical protein J2Z19_002640 [Ensifer adhaerens]|uniref:Uncharacterized protein n=1 Tax=Ensifer adhaerens TaxID=106592 RepID=A0ACC5SVU2_ENSAD|nr:hypothetical protein [Ensifer adhaerens]MBP1872928.1 hypothetical protein [Ensifer adhaerens]